MMQSSDVQPLTAGAVAKQTCPVPGARAAVPALRPAVKLVAQGVLLSWKQSTCTCTVLVKQSTKSVK